MLFLKSIKGYYIFLQHSNRYQCHHQSVKSYFIIFEVRPCLLTVKPSVEILYGLLSSQSKEKVQAAQVLGNQDTGYVLYWKFRYSYHYFYPALKMWPRFFFWYHSFILNDLNDTIRAVINLAYDRLLSRLPSWVSHSRYDAVNSYHAMWSPISVMTIYL